jgi:hypothetical protein
LQEFKETPFPDGTVVYRKIWDDQDGLVVLMDDYETTLRRRIDPNIQLTEYQWLTIMLGIVDRLAFTHQYDVAHGDLCPSNGSFQIFQSI